MTISFMHHGEMRDYNIRQAMSHDATDMYGQPYTDVDYITHSWLHAYKQSPEMNNPGLTERDYFHYTHKKIDEILPRASAAGSVYMCIDGENENRYRGYLVAEAFEDFPPIIHWLQVKKEHKRQGVATALLKQFFIDFDFVPGACVYTFSSDDLKRKRSIRVAFEEMGCRLLYIPDMKTTLNRPDWEV